MAIQANLKTLTIDGDQYSPSGEWTLSFGNESREVQTNLDGTNSTKITPEADIASGSIRISSAKDIFDLQKKTDFTMTAILRNGDIYQISNATIQNHAEVDTDAGAIDLEIAGTARFL
jgi:hypothetical protein